MTKTIFGYTITIEKEGNDDQLFKHMKKIRKQYVGDVIGLIKATRDHFGGSVPLKALVQAKNKLKPLY